MSGTTYIKRLLTVAFILFLGRLTFLFCKAFKQYIARTPTLVLKAEGLWLSSYGHIPWENIERVEKVVINPLLLAGQDIIALGICLKSPEQVFTRHWLDLKVLNRLKRNNAKHHILLLQLDLDPQEIAQFAKKFIR